MKKLVMLAVVFLLISIIYGTAGAGIYKWVDDKGRTHFSDHPPQKSTSKEKVEALPTRRLRFEYEENYKSKYNNTEGGSYDETPVYEEASTRKEHEVELYVTSWCPYCKKARNFFRSRGIPFKEYDIEKDRSAAERKNRLDKRRGIPFAVINGQGIHGYIPAAYERALGDVR